MKKWYKESYFNRKNWILENFEKLNLNTNEVVLILLIELSKENKKALTYEYFTQKLHLDIKSIDKILASLVSKHYLEISTNSKGLVLNDDNLFEFDAEKYELIINSDLIDNLSEVFGKPLSASEIQKVNELISEYGENSFIEAVRIAEAKRKLKLVYIEGILRNEK